MLVAAIAHAGTVRQLPGDSQVTVVCDLEAKSPHKRLGIARLLPCLRSPS